MVKIKYIKIVNEILLCIVLLMCIFYLYKQNYNKYDLNNDREVNSLDLLLLQKYVLGRK